MRFRRNMILIPTLISILIAQPAYSVGPKSFFKFLHMGQEADSAAVAEVKASTQGADTLLEVVTSAGERRSFTIATPAETEIAKDAPSAIYKEFNYSSAKKAPLALRLAQHLHKRFLPESATFFAAMGALSVYHLIHDYSENPAAGEAFFQSQTSFVGSLGFAAFMAGNAGTAELLESARVNPAIRQYVFPSLAMSAGMVANKIVSELTQVKYGELSQQMHACLSASKTAESLRVCDVAHANFVKAMHSHIFLSQTPGLVGQAGALALISGGKKLAAMGVDFAANLAAEKGLTTAAAKIPVWVASRWVGLSFVLNFTEAGWFARAAQGAFLLLQIGEMAGFIEISGKVEAWTDYRLKAYVTSAPDALREEEQIHKDLLSKDLASLNSDLLKYSWSMEDWRLANGIAEFNAYNGWLHFTNKLADSYDYAKNFYRVFIGALWYRKFQPNSGFGYDAEIFTRPYPYFGVKSVNPEYPVEVGNYLTQPADMEVLQLQNIRKVGAQMNQLLKQDYYKNLGGGIVSFIANRLLSPKIEEVIEGLQKIHDIYTIDKSLNGSLGHSELQKFVASIVDVLGDPRPSMLPGEGFIRLMSAAADAKSIEASNTDTRKAEKHQLRDTYALMQNMVFGPNAEDSTNALIHKNGEYMDEFIAPRIRSESNETLIALPHFDPKGNWSLTRLADHNAFDTGVYQAKLPQPIFEGAVYEFLLGDHLRQSAVNSQVPNSASLESWWQKFVEPRYTSAWQDYSKKYAIIVHRFYGDLYNSGFASGMPRGLIAIENRQFNLYMSALQSVWQFPANDPQLKSLVDLHNSLLEQLKPARSTFKPGELQTVGPQLKAQVIGDVMNAVGPELEKLKARLVSGSHTQVRTDVTQNLIGLIAESFGTLRDYAFILQSANHDWKYKDGVYLDSPCVNTAGASTKGTTSNLPQCQKQH